MEPAFTSINSFGSQVCVRVYIVWEEVNERNVKKKKIFILQMRKWSPERFKLTLSPRY